MASVFARLAELFLCDMGLERFEVVFVTVIVAVAIVVIAGDQVVFEVAGKVFGGDVVDGAGAAADDFDLVGLEDVDCALAHVAGEHYFDAEVGENRGYVGFAAAAFRGVHCLFVNDIFVIIQSEDGVVVTMAEVVVDIAVTGGQCNFHICLLHFRVH